ncbi:MAG TPA: helix-turn-helix domain-containing protein, partial [Streptomyces sp.]
AYLATVPDLPEPSPEQAAALARAAQERRAQAAEQVDVPGEVRAVLLGLLADGTTVRQAAEHLEAYGVPRMSVWRLLDRLRHEGVARMSGRGRGARWHLTGDDGGDGEEDTDNGHAA